MHISWIIKMEGKKGILSADRFDTYAFTLRTIALPWWSKLVIGMIGPVGITYCKLPVLPVNSLYEADYSEENE
jgi:hypothetical protein